MNALVGFFRLADGVLPRVGVPGDGSAARLGFPSP